MPSWQKVRPLKDSMCDVWMAEFGRVRDDLFDLDSAWTPTYELETIEDPDV